MIKIAKIYVDTTGYLLRIVNILWCSINSQHSKLSNPYYNNLSIKNCKQENLPTFMLELCVFFTHELALVYLEAI